MLWQPLVLERLNAWCCTVERGQKQRLSEWACIDFVDKIQYPFYLQARNCFLSHPSLRIK